LRSRHQRARMLGGLPACRGGLPRTRQTSDSRGKIDRQSEESSKLLKNLINRAWAQPLLIEPGILPRRERRKCNLRAASSSLASSFCSVHHGSFFCQMGLSSTFSLLYVAFQTTSQRVRRCLLESSKSRTTRLMGARGQRHRVFVTVHRVGRLGCAFDPSQAPPVVVVGPGDHDVPHGWPGPSPPVTECHRQQRQSAARTYPA
jgi:hypothetical protein